MESLSSCEPHANCHPEPPMAQAPKPTRVMFRSEFPRVRVSIPISCNFGFMVKTADSRTFVKFLENYHKRASTPRANQHRCFQFTPTPARARAFDSAHLARLASRVFCISDTHVHTSA